MYFVTKELQCKCGCGVSGVDARALSMLNELRKRWGKPMVLTSAYRCANHPVEAKKAKPGMHNTGLAFDIRTTPREQPKLIKLALEVGFKGFGFHKSFLHVDARDQDHISAWYY